VVEHLLQLHKVKVLSAAATTVTGRGNGKKVNNDLPVSGRELA